LIKSSLQLSAILKISAYANLCHKIHYLTSLAAWVYYHA
jgi:hypothetical protein